MSLLVMPQILALFLNILTKYRSQVFSCSRDKLQQSRKQKTFSEFLALFLKFTSSFGHIDKNMTLITYVFPKLRTAKDLIR